MSLRDLFGSSIRWVGGNTNDVPPKVVNEGSTAITYQQTVSGDSVYYEAVDTDLFSIQAGSVYTLLELYEVICREYSNEFPVDILNRTFERIMNAVSLLHTHSVLSSEEVASIYNRIFQAQQTVVDSDEIEVEDYEEEQPSSERSGGRVRKLKF